MSICRVTRGFGSNPAHRWFVYCHECSDFLFDFMPIRTSERFDLAVGWAHQHAGRHLDAKCRTCGRMGRIEDDTKQVTA